jgi:RNA-directed DNA polymerase
VAQRLGQFGLKLHPEKTRLIEFGRFARENRRRRGQSKPETFDFLGFTHCCGKTRKGKFMVLRLTSAKRLRAKLLAVKTELRRRMHRPLPSRASTCARWWLDMAATSPCPATGHGAGLSLPGRAGCGIARLCRRSQTKHLPWKRMHDRRPLVAIPISATRTRTSV